MLAAFKAFMSGLLKHSVCGLACGQRGLSCDGGPQICSLNRGLLSVFTTSGKLNRLNTMSTTGITVSAEVLLTNSTIGYRDNYPMGSGDMDSCSVSLRAVFAWQGIQGITASFVQSLHMRTTPWYEARLRSYRYISCASSTTRCWSVLGTTIL